MQGTIVTIGQPCNLGMDYERLDKALDSIHQVLDGIRVEVNLEPENIEPWRWGQPQISLIWRGQDSIWRNITTLMLGLPNGEMSPSSHVEINAWHDTREDRGWVRHWQHELIMEEGRFDPSLLWQAYKTVTHWTHSAFTRHQPLSGAAITLLEAQLEAQRG